MKIWQSVQCKREKQPWKVNEIMAEPGDNGRLSQEEQQRLSSNDRPGLARPMGCGSEPVHAVQLPGASGKGGPFSGCPVVPGPNCSGDWVTSAQSYFQILAVNLSLTSTFMKIKIQSVSSDLITKSPSWAWIKVNKNQSSLKMIPQDLSSLTTSPAVLGLTLR